MVEISVEADRPHGDEATRKVARPRGFARVLVLGLASCASSRSSVQAPVDITIAPVANLPQNRIAENGQASSGTCILRLSATRIQKSSPGCYLDEHISDGPGILHYPCGGEGTVEADFGDQRYKGQIEHGEIHLEFGTELDWEDGCRWGTSAVIEGSITANGEPTLKKLSWSYHDRVISGTDCSGVCTARASIDVARATPRHHATDDEDTETE
jgi:hypothetical protein